MCASDASSLKILPFNGDALETGGVLLFTLCGAAKSEVMVDFFLLLTADIVNDSWIFDLLSSFTVLP